MIVAVQAAIVGGTGQCAKREKSAESDNQLHFKHVCLSCPQPSWSALSLAESAIAHVTRRDAVPSSHPEKEEGMPYHRQWWSRVGVVLGLIVMLSGCAPPARGRPLSPAEQAEFAIYRKIMTPVQTRTYLAKATAAERTAYLQESGLAQRFQALEPLDREAVQYGFLRKGMSAEALRFVWGEPATRQGDVRRAAQWHYVGALHTLTAYGNQFYDTSHGVDVYLADGKVVTWSETFPDAPRPDVGGGRRR
jgi:hypothetical protein